MPESTSRRVLLIFIDGVGIGTKDPERNPFFNTPPPFLTELLGGSLPSLGHRRIESADAICLPADANLGTPGFPQSGTGQATLYTGVNGARHIGKHFGPYLYSTLKPVVAEHNLFSQLLAPGLDHFRVALANAFPQHFFDYLSSGNTRMIAGMYAAISAGVKFRNIDDLKDCNAVSTDLTASRWKDIGHPDAPVLTPFEAGEVLASISNNHHFTLFEYFLTDKAGHERSMKKAVSLLGGLDDFLRGVHGRIDRHTLVLLTSDHGNMEELSIKTHTRNPVPVLLFGNTDRFPADEIRSRSDITPAIRTFLQG